MRLVSEKSPPGARLLAALVILGLVLVGCRKRPTAGSGVQQGAHSVTLTWIASTSAVAAYDVYRSTKSGGPYFKLTVIPASMTKYTDKFVESGKTYFYVVTAVDSRGVESLHSNEVSASVPTP
jgi:fibronectin type 3 domain-containing protein